MWLSKRALFSLFVCCFALIQVAYSQNEDEGINDEPLTVSIDQMIIDAANSSSEFDFLYDENATLIKVQLDMVYAVDEYNEMEIADGYANASEGSRRRRTAGLIAGRGGARRWTNNQVPYQLADGTFSGRDTNTIGAAINDWQHYTCLSFRQRSSGNRIYFKNGGGCYSRVGMVGGAQDLGLAPGCRHKGVVIHEIGHALGLHHEQTRPDRDQHVTIVRQNIPARMYYNFQKNTWNTILNMGIPYDYTSIMHYGKTAFSVNGQLTIRTRDPAKQNVIGNRQGLSFGDIKSINIMYNCKRHSSGCTKTDAECPGEGFVDKNCQCVCPGSGLSEPTKRCTGGGGGRVTTRRPVVTRRPVTPRPTPQPSGCRDMNSNCIYWKTRGECTRSRNYMWSYCKRSCGRCGGGTGTGTVTSRCRNIDSRCAGWRRYCNRGYFRNYMMSYCKRTCGLCRSGYRHRTNSGQSSGSCTDSNRDCPSWAATGECRRNPAYMLTSCRLSCEQCHVSDSASSANCGNHHQHCTYWHSQGQCTSAQFGQYMRQQCPQICGFC